VAGAPTAFNDDGSLRDEKAGATLRTVLTRLVAVAERMM
jgi:hypothetical protein